MTDYEDPTAMVDIERYPIADLDAPDARVLIESCRASLEADGALSMPGFIRPEAAEAIAAEARELAPLAFEISTEHTCYFEPADEGFPEDHPRRRMLFSRKGGVANDQIDETALLNRLYQWDGLMAFVAAVLGEDRLYRHADSMAALNINVFDPGQSLDWHFDRADFSVTLSIETASGGGLFEYVPGLRAPDDENYDGVAEVIEGAAGDIQLLPFDAGTLALIRGHYSLHRVTPVIGERARLAAVFSYVREPDVIFTPYARQLFYGREDSATPR